jgi:hypothetical protein
MRSGAIIVQRDGKCKREQVKGVAKIMGQGNP